MQRPKRTEADRDVLKQRALELLMKHVGKNNAIAMAELTAQIERSAILPSQRYEASRITRSIVKQLRAEGHPICHINRKGGGYFWAANDQELADCAGWFRQRAMSAFEQEAALRRISLTELVDQLQLDLKTPQMKQRLQDMRAERDQSQGATT